MTGPYTVGGHSAHAPSSFHHHRTSPDQTSPASAFTNARHYGAFKPIAPAASALPQPNFAARRASNASSVMAPGPKVAPADVAPLASARQLTQPQSVVIEEHTPSYEEDDFYEEENTFAEIAHQQQKQQQTRVLGGGCWDAQGEPMAAASSPWSDRSEYESENEDEYEEEESFDGPLKDQYRGRAWSQSQEPQTVAAVGPTRAHGWSEPPSDTSALAYENRNMATTFTTQQQPNKDLDRLFHGLRLPVPEQQQRAYQPQQVAVAPVVKAPVLPAPQQAPAAQPTSSLSLAPFLTEAVWSLLMNPFAAQASAKATAVVVSDGHSYERVRKADPYPVTPPNGRNGSVSSGGWRNVKGNAWEEERWSTDASYAQQHQNQTPPALTLDDFSSSPYQSASPVLRRNPYMLATSVPPASFTRFAHQTLAQTLIQPTGVMLALWYISRSPIHEGGGEEGRQFREGLRHCGDGATGEEIAKRVLTLGLAWANKWLEDNTYTNRSWSDVTRIPIGEINTLELLALSTMSFDLSVSVAEWSAWLNRIYSSTDNPVVRTSVVEMSDSLADAEHKRSLERRGADYQHVQAEQAQSAAAVSRAAVVAQSVNSPARRTPVKSAVSSLSSAVARPTWGNGGYNSSSSVPRKSVSSSFQTNIWGEFGQQQPRYTHHPALLQQRHSLAPSSSYSSFASSAASSRSSRGSMPNAQASYYAPAQQRTGGLQLPSIQQGFGAQRGWEMMGNGLVPMPQTATCW